MSYGMPDVSELDFAAGYQQRTLEEFHVQKSADRDLQLLCGFTVAALQQNMLLDLPLSLNPCLSYQYLVHISRVQQRIMCDLLNRLPIEARFQCSQQDLLDSNPAWRDTHMQLGIILNHFRYMHQKHLGDLSMAMC